MTAPTGPGEVSKPRLPLVAAASVGLISGGVLAWVSHAALLDDAYISVDFARNLANQGCWCVTPGMVSNTATSPLWVGLLAALMLVLPPVVVWSCDLCVASDIGCGDVGDEPSRLGWSPIAGPLAALLLASSPLIQASVGLESLLAVTLMALAAHELAAERTATIGLLASAMIFDQTGYDCCFDCVI